ncbi:MAG: ABC transporter ATP-binding protein, partial [Terracidiphilus sp.]
LARILVSPSNFLLLDEPTNHLDMRAKDVLLEAIAAFSGTVVFVSHDRYFIDRLATRVLEVEGGTVTSHEGNYEDYLRRKEAQSANAKSQTASHPERAERVEGPASQPRSTSNAAFQALYQGTTSVVPKSAQGNGALAPAEVAPLGTTIVIEGGPDDAVKKRRLNPIKQKQLEDRCVFLEEEVPRIEASIAHTEEQLSTYVSAAETQRLTDLAQDLRRQLASLTAEWEDLMLQLEA